MFTLRPGTPQFPHQDIPTEPAAPASRCQRACSCPCLPAPADLWGVLGSPGLGLSTERRCPSCHLGPGSHEPPHGLKEGAPLAWVGNAVAACAGPAPGPGPFSAQTAADLQVLGPRESHADLPSCLPVCAVELLGGLGRWAEPGRGPAACTPSAMCPCISPQAGHHAGDPVSAQAPRQCPPRPIWA